MSRLRHFAAWMASGLAALALAGPAGAGPEDDYRAGARAYRAGDVTGAMAQLKLSADAGHAPAQALLAGILVKAGFDEESVAYYRKAAAQGDPDGEFGLGAMYAAGEGVKRDPQEARQWIARAAQQGHPQAINVLAQAYMAGELGIDENERAGPVALMWIRRAADAGHVPALDYLAGAYRRGALGLAVDEKQAERLEARAKALRGSSGKKASKGSNS